MWRFLERSTPSIAPTISAAPAADVERGSALYVLCNHALMSRRVPLHFSCSCLCFPEGWPMCYRAISSLQACLISVAG